MTSHKRSITPSNFAATALTLLLLFVLAACSQAPNPVTSAPAASTQATRAATAAAPSAATSAPTQLSASAPSCNNTAALTPEMTEGPYFKAGSPERASLLASGMTGTKLVVTGYVFTLDCKPIAHALVDFWQADANGNYDNSGYTLRGHQFTDNAGRYQLTTVVPGLYPGRTEHIHVKVQAPNGPILTTQLFFPGVARNQTDSIFDPKLLLAVQNTSDGLAATFSFVVSVK